MLFLILFAAFLPALNAEVVEGHLKTEQKWEFLHKYCISNFDKFSYEIEYDSQFGYLTLLLYPENLCGNVTNNPEIKSCEEKVGISNSDQHQRILLIPPHTKYRDSISSGCEYIRADNEMRNGKLICKSNRIFRTSQPRLWFISVASCNNTKGLDINYKLQVKNDYNETVYDSCSKNGGNRLTSYLLLIIIIICTLLNL